MNSFIEYFIESTASLGVFYSLYYLFLRHETFFRLNRFYLITTMIFSVLLPFLTFRFYAPAQNNQFAILLDTIQVGAQYSRHGIESFASAALVLKTAVKSLIIIMSLYFILRYILQVLQLYAHIQKHGFTKENNLKVVYTNKKFSAFSFFNYVFINRDEMKQINLNKILSHERIHAIQHHTIDILIFEIIKSLCWYNPFVWLYTKALKETHEYLADRGVIEQGFDAANYQLLLLKQTIGIQFGLANNFNKSLTIKRLSMMKKSKSKLFAGAKYLIAVPLFIALFFVFACSDKDEANINEIPQTGRMSGDYIDEKPIFYMVEEMPEFPGNMEGLRSFIAQNVKYPQIAKESGAEGKIYVRFVVTKSGAVDDAVIMRTSIPEKKANKTEGEVKGVTVVGYKKITGDSDITPDIAALQEEAIRVVSAMPDWKPGKQRGEAVNVYFTVPINFVLQ